MNVAEELTIAAELCDAPAVRRTLWERGVPIDARERIVAMVRHRATPYELLERADSQRHVFELSWSLRCDILARLAAARAADAHQRERTELFVEYCREQECLEAPRAFASTHARFVYFRSKRPDPHYAPHEDFRCAAVVMSGLPGAGKDTWVGENLPDWPVVSLDALRRQLGIDPAGPQGEVVRAAKQRARELLRNGQRFVWNATNLSRQIRGQIVDLLADYRARVRIVYVEVPPEVLLERNAIRSNPVPAAVIERLIERWDVPAAIEAHEVDLVHGEQRG